MYLITWLVIAMFCFSFNQAQKNYDFEETFVTRLDEKLFSKTRFNFIQTLDISSIDNWNSSSYTSLFPAGPISLILKSIQRSRKQSLNSNKFIKQSEIKHVRVSLTRGIWRSDLWGSDILDSDRILPPTGMFVEIIYKEKIRNNTSSISQKEKAMSNDISYPINLVTHDFELQESIEDAEAALSSLSCESISRSGGSSASSFGGILGGWSGGSSGVRRESYYSKSCPSSFYSHNSSLLVTNRMICAEFPSTVLCVESISSFLSLLPCKGLAGIASIIQKNFYSLFNAPYLSLFLEITINDRNTITLTQSLFIVQIFENSIFENSIKLNDSYHKESYIKCPVASSSIFTVIKSNNNDSIDDDNNNDKSIIRQQSLYHLVLGRRVSDIRLGVGSILYSVHIIPSLALIQLSNHIQTRSFLTVEIFETLPYMFLRTRSSLMAWISLEINNETMQMPVDSVSITYLQHRVEKGLPEAVKMTIHISQHVASLISSSSVIYISNRFSSILLHSQEYPPDTHKGFDIPSSVISTCININLTNSQDIVTSFSKSFCMSEHTQPLFSEIPAPDFSMPYNAATLVSTVMAFTLGTFVNALARRPRH
jgi:hypothetical protein